MTIINLKCQFQTRTDQASVSAFKTPIKPMKSPRQCMPCTCTWKGTVEHCVSMRQYQYTMHGGEANCRLTHDRLTQRTQTLNHSMSQTTQRLKGSKTHKQDLKPQDLRLFHSMEPIGRLACYALSNKTTQPLSEVWQSGRNTNIVRFTKSNLAYCIAWGIVSPQSDSPTKLHDSRVTATSHGSRTKPKLKYNCATTSQP